MSTDRTTEIRAIGQIDIRSNRYKLEEARVFAHSLDGKIVYLSRAGTFILAYKPLYRFSGSFHETMWTAKLLDYDLEQTKLSTYRGQLIVQDGENKVLKSIPPEEIRKVGIEAERGIVRASGYVLGGDRYYPLGSRKDILVDEYEQILIAAEAGLEPPGFEESTRVKVDPALAGKELWIGIFDLELGRSDVWDREAVVIDLETRAMIEREVLRPLSAERWGRKHPERE